MSNRLAFGLLVGAGAVALATPGRAGQVEQVAAAPADIVVTARKRSESLQSVPISLQVLDTRLLEQKNIASFNDYAKFLPSLSYSSLGPGQAEIFFRGISNGNRLSTGSLPTVGVYLDEAPVTTIASALDVHIYDIARVEALAGPQGTLFGASSEAGTLRIITNKPRQGVQEGGADLELNSVSKGGMGFIGDGYINVPLTDRIALRLVGFVTREGGYIDNVEGEAGQVFPTSGIARDNSRFVEKNVNSITTHGGRAALGIDLDENWTVTPSLIYQKQTSDGTFATRESLGGLRNSRYLPDSSYDRWYQAALVVEGKVGRFDLTYAGAYFERTAQYTSDYSDYAFFYDRYNAETPDYFGNQFFDDGGALIDPSQSASQTEHFSKQSHELRLVSPQTDRLRFVAGLFYQRQTNDWTNLYEVAGLAPSQSVTGRPGVNYANIQVRVDRDYAVFGEAAYDLAAQLTLTAGLRAYRYDNDVVGFFGYNADRSEVGEALCIPGTIGVYGTQRPCDNIDARAKGSGVTHKLNLAWKPLEGKLLYATWSSGFRPGGINRRPAAAPYATEKLDNFEVGWKISWVDSRLRFNGALFLQKLKDAQFGVSSDQNGITDIVNSGRAESKGVEADITVLPLKGLSLQASGAWVDAKLSTDLCQYPNPANDCSLPSEGGNANSLTAPAGTRFPYTPRFKIAATARYEVALSGYDSFVQASLLHQSSALPSLTVVEAELIGSQPAYTTVDLSVGASRGGWTLALSAENLFDARGQQLRSASCNIEICGPTSIQVYPIRPRLVSLRLGWRF